MSSGLPALQRGRRAAVSSAEQALRAQQRRHHDEFLSFSEWACVFGGAKMTTALLDRITHHCHILRSAKDSCRFKNSSAQPIKKESKTKKLPKA
jgi:hypothetical protein